MPTNNHRSIFADIDFIACALYLCCVSIGYFTIYAAIYDPQSTKSFFDLSLNSTKQLVWIITSFILIIIVFALDYRFFDVFAYLLYVTVLFLLVIVLIFGRKVSESTSWIEIGNFRMQPSEFAKLATSLALAKFMSTSGIKIEQRSSLFIILAIISIPALLILLQNDTGSALVFSSFVLVLYREGLSPWVLIIGVVAVVLFLATLIVGQLNLIIFLSSVCFLVIILFYRKLRQIILICFLLALACSFIVSVDYTVNHILKKHQRDRIRVLIEPDFDPLKTGWNVTQSKIAIGSGGFWGKGYLAGTQTKLDYVPEQSTDFIFCTIGEEFGWIGSFVVISLLVGLLVRIVIIAERQRDNFGRIYGYCVASVLFFHFTINIGMTIGLLPVIGIPLPFISYGGSSLWAFTLLLFILLKMDSQRKLVLARK
ncbi:MAG: rod shape-determining protein RodA [Microscillaceae bacterium]|nr:rod shape-determining protein RodA [Microscillaceae bacterium]MDW8459784.1 rod shape-determining protein RodA [Cytophagales bacterium]